MATLALLVFLLVPARAVDTPIESISVVEPARDAVMGLYNELPVGQGMAIGAFLGAPNLDAAGLGRGLSGAAESARGTDPAAALAAFLERAKDPAHAPDTAARLALLDDALRGNPGVSADTWHSLERAAALARRRLTDEQEETVSRTLAETSRALEAMIHKDDGVGAGAAVVAGGAGARGGLTLEKAAAGGAKPSASRAVDRLRRGFSLSAPARRRVAAGTALWLPALAALAAPAALASYFASPGLAAIGLVLVGFAFLWRGVDRGPAATTAEGNVHSSGTYLGLAATAALVAVAGAMLGAPFSGFLVAATIANIGRAALRHSDTKSGVLVPVAAATAAGLAALLLGSPAAAFFHVTAMSVAFRRMVAAEGRANPGAVSFLLGISLVSLGADFPAIGWFALLGARSWLRKRYDWSEDDPDAGAPREEFEGSESRLSRWLRRFDPAEYVLRALEWIEALPDRLRRA